MSEKKHAPYSFASFGPPTGLLALSLFLTGLQPEQGCQSTDADGDGFSAADGDCDDTDPAVNPAASEICNDSIDNNCDGQIDECMNHIAFISPSSYEVYNPVTFQVDASGIASVVYVADGQWNLGQSSDASSNYSVIYSFTSYGERMIEARGMDAQGNVVTAATISIEVLSDNTSVCYLGSQRDYSACYSVEALGSPAPSGYDYDESCSASYGSNYRTPDNVLDLYLIDPEDKIAPNFTMGEVAQSSKGQYAVVQSHVIDHLQSIRDDLGVLNITSGYRSPSYNASVGGASCSRHMYGDAYDMYASSASLEQVGAECDALGADYVDLYEDGHVHCDWRDAALDPAFYGTSKQTSLAAPESKRRVSLRIEGTNRDGRVARAEASGWDEGEPLRQWSAFDGDGKLLGEYEGQMITLPERTQRILCWVGGSVLVETGL